MGGRSKTPSFIVTRRIQPDDWQKAYLNKIFLEVGWLYNDTLAEAEKRAAAMKANKGCQSVLAYKDTLSSEISRFEKQISARTKQTDKTKDLSLKKRLTREIAIYEQGLEGLKMDLERCSASLKKICQAFGFTESDLQTYTNRLRNEKYNGDIQSNIAQKIATAAWQAEEKVFYGNGRKVHYRKRGTSGSFEDKSAKSGIIYHPADPARKKRPFEHVSIMGHPMHLKPIRKGDAWLKEAMMHKAKYCRVTRKAHGNDYHYFLQIIMEGGSPIKHPMGKGSAGLDPGVSTMSYDSEEGTEMLFLSPDIARYQKAVKNASLVYERRRRLANPQNYNEDGTIKKDTKDFKKTWKQTKGVLKALMTLKTAYRKMSEYVRQFNGHLSNQLLMKISELNEESMDYKALAKRAKSCKRQKKSSVVKNKKGKAKPIHKYTRKKRFGASILKHAPAGFLRMLERKIHRQGGIVNELNARKMKASQYDHVTDTCTKHELSDRTKMVGWDLVQRDLYSCFLMRHADKNGNIDRQACIDDFDAFLKRQKAFVQYLIANGGYPTGNFGLDEFKKQMPELQAPA